MKNFPYENIISFFKEEQLAVCGVIILLFLLILIRFLVLHSNVQFCIRYNIKHKRWIKAEEFLAEWIIEEHRDGKPNIGYKYAEICGCYVIKTYEGHLIRRKKNVYVGQSSNVCARVHNHLVGKGNGDIYHDYREEFYIKIRFVPTSKHRLNATEKKLIQKYKATSSYNKTKGGGKKRTLLG